MAHFAKIGLNNEVLEVVVVNNVDTMTPQGVEDEAIGLAFLRNLTGHETWVQTSYNGSFRGRFAGSGYTYDADRDVFIPPKPFPSWLLDEDTLDWIAPVLRPEGEGWVWDEESGAWTSHDGENP